MFLVTTAEETTWDTSKHICFLGEWCLRYSRREMWAEVNHCVFPYHWDDRDKYNRDYIYLEQVYEKCLIILSNELDRGNSTSSGVDYWRIVVGPWLRFFIDVIFDRFEVIYRAYHSRIVDNTWILPYAMNDWIPDGFIDFFDSINDDQWNHFIFAECIRAIGIPYSEMPKGTTIKSRRKDGNSKDKKKLIIRKTLEVYQSLIPSRLNRHVTVSPYIRYKYVARLQLSLGQLPYLISPSIEIYDNPIDIERRADLSIYIGEKPFELLLGELIPQLIPKAYLEDYNHYCTNEVAKFPRRPLTIFTANAYQANDSFKYWAAENKKQGVPLIIGQHGGNLGMAHHNQTEDHQLKIADSYCSWGWKRADIDSIDPMPSLQLSISDLSDNPNGGILLVLASFPRYFYCHCSTPVAGQFVRYLNQQMQLINELNVQIRASVNIRLNGDEYGWDIVDRFKDAGMGDMIDASEDRFMVAASKYRLCIVSYNATVILETLNANFPTIAYWDPEFFDIRSEALPFVDMLRNVGILHDTVESASLLINKIYDDVQSWWQRPELQAARLEFCNVYANSSDNWVEDWRKHLNSVKRKNTQ